MILKAMPIEYGMQNSRSAATLLGADGRVSVFQKSLSFIFQVDYFVKD